MKLSPEELIVIIDPQKDFTDIEGAYAKNHPDISQIQEVKARINKLTKQFDQNRFVIIYSNYQKDQFGAGISMCIQGTRGHEIDIDFDDASQLISKTQHSSFSSEAFKIFLQRNNIRKLLLCGFLAEYCIKQTALDALQKGYEVNLLQEFIGTGNDVQERKQEMLVDLENKGATIVKDTFDCI
ncbi:cysteine hydrolase [Flavobacterium sp. ANB]|uniref:cysteine hydrolase family protein n=1 Tax=unclassified Flavobacterium TaxID=196869 RepID=UPI0012B6B9C8|nr:MULTISPECIES: isochorismatase family cysteine hydrolase [unclassified Flavobacterium]MBF4515067.1 cysteine hydrolase [Flavobacterium sp. ANB]MTD69979.1 isochorismatase family protein [Flavobacterium sp. LC2016-13]